MAFGLGRAQAARAEGGFSFGKELLYYLSPCSLTSFVEASVICSEIPTIQLKEKPHTVECPNLKRRLY
jgi:hypothetical protein